MKKRLLVVLGAMLAVAASPAVAQETNNGVPLLTGTSAFMGTPDAGGGAILVNSYKAVCYARRFSSSGAAQWWNAVQVGPSSSAPSAIAADGHGGAFFLVDDYTLSPQYADMVAQWIDPQADTRWSASGLRMTTLSSPELGKAVVPDGQGGAIFVWDDYRCWSWDCPDVYAQHVDSSGVALWTANGIAVSSQVSVRGTVAAISDGAGGIEIIWVDSNLGGAANAQRLRPGGSRAWPDNGIYLGSARTRQFRAAMSDGRGGALLVWEDERVGTAGLYVQRLDSLGVLPWGTEGVQVCPGGAETSFLYAVADSSGGATVFWASPAGGPANASVYAQHIDSGGQPAWASVGMPVSSVASTPATVAAAPDKGGSVVLVWSVAGSENLYGQLIDHTGARAWGDQGVVVCSSAGAPLCVSPGDSGLFTVWNDVRNGAAVYGQTMSRAGRPLLPDPEPPRLVDVSDVRNDQGGAVKVRWMASILDVSSPYTVTSYWIWRSVPSSSALASTHEAVLPNSLLPALTPSRQRIMKTQLAGVEYFWEFIAELPAGRLPMYSYVAPTTSDSLGSSNPYTAFLVQAWAGDKWWFSNPDSGYSVDNLSPVQPAPFVALYGGSGVALHWGVSLEGDLREYRLYRGASPNFIPSPSSLLAAQPDTGFFDPGGAASFAYKLSAVDIHGNESRFALVTAGGPVGTLASLMSAEVEGSVVRVRWLATANPGLSATVYRRTPESPWTALGHVAADGTGIMTWDDTQVGLGQRYGYRLGVWDGGVEIFLGEAWIEVPTLTFALEGVRPNPSRGEALLVSFSLPDAAPARLELLDVSGRRVAEREAGSLGAGHHTLDLRDGRPLAPGLYLVRLMQGANTRVTRVAVLR